MKQMFMSGFLKSPFSPEFKPALQYLNHNLLLAFKLLELSYTKCKMENVVFFLYKTKVLIPCYILLFI